MKQTILALIAGLVLFASSVFAQDDVLIDESGNVISGSTNVNGGNLEVLTTGEDGIVSITNGADKSGIYGQNEGSGYGVQGLSDTGIGGYFNSNSGPGLVVGSGNVGIGTLSPSPAYNLDVVGTINASTAVKVNGTDVLTSYTETDPTVAASVKDGVDWTELSGIPAGFVDNTDDDTTYSAGTGLDLTGTTFSVEVPLVLSGSASGGILSGTNVNATGYGIYGYASNSGAVTNIGGSFQANGATGYGVVGNGMGASGTGVHGYAAGIAGRGIYGVAVGSFGKAVYGYASGDSGDGVWGSANGSSGRGVYGNATNGGIGGYFNSVGGYGLIVENGNVGIGMTNPSETLSVAGTIESTSGGIKFPDGTIQATSANYSGVAIVAKSGGNYSDPVTAMSDISAWCGTPSATNPCMLKIMPGVYNIGTNGLQMQAYVDIEGSGENVTIITGDVDGGSSGTSGAVVKGANNAEIRMLTVENTGGGVSAVAILNLGSISPNITQVTAVASGGGGNYGIHNRSSAFPKMTNVTAKASDGTVNYGVRNYSSSPLMINVIASASGEIGQHFGVSNYSSSPMMLQIIASALGGSSSSYSVAVHNSNSSSPEMIQVTATASGPGAGGYTVGVWNSESSAKMFNVHATASGVNGAMAIWNWQYSSTSMTFVTATASCGTGCSGIYNGNNSFPIMTNVTATATGGSSYNYGIYTSSAAAGTVVMTNVTATGSGTSSNDYGLYSNAGETQIDNSVVSGSTGSIIRSANPGSVFVGNSKLEGSVSGSSFTCAGAYDGSYNALNVSCL